MRAESNGYSHGYRADIVRSYARAAVDAIQRHMHEQKADAVVVHGNSGVSIGFAALMQWEFPLFLLRKDGDSSHGSPLEGPTEHSFRRYLILDDFVSSGNTVLRIADKLETLHEMRSSSDESRPVPAGVIQYRRSASDNTRNPAIQWASRNQGRVYIPVFGVEGTPQMF